MQEKQPIEFNYQKIIFQHHRMPAQMRFIDNTHYCSIARWFKLMDLLGFSVKLFHEKCQRKQVLPTKHSIWNIIN